MPTHYFTLQRLCKEFQILIGARLQEVFTFRKEECVLWFELKDGSQRGMLCDVSPHLASVCLLPQRWEKPRQRVSLFEQFAGKSVTEIRLHPQSRIIIIELAPCYQLLISVIGGDKSNLGVIDPRGAVVEQFKRRRLELTDIVNQPWVGKTLEDFSPNTPLLSVLARMSWRLGQMYAREVLMRCHIAADVPIGDISEEQWARIERTVKHLVADCHREDRIYLYQAKSLSIPKLSLVPLQIPDLQLLETVAGLSAGIQRWRRYARERLELRDTVRNLGKQLERRQQRLQRTLIHIAPDQLEDRRRQYQRWGDLLLMQTELHRRGQSYLTVTDWDGKHYDIPLEPSRTILENAQRYYHKAKAVQQKAQVFEAKRRRLYKELQEVEQLLAELKQVEQLSQLAGLFTRYPTLKAMVQPKKPAIEETSFRQITVGHYGMVAIGKNARSNDFVTLRWAKPNDLWFHVRNGTGAHVVFRPVQAVTPKVIEAVASLAAYYSSERDATLIPVMWTYRKYIRKSKRMPTGAVAVEREQVVMVPPRSPDEVLTLLEE